MLYDRNYNILTEEERIRLEQAESFKEKLCLLPDGWTAYDIFKYHEILPDAARYYNSLFPNNLLNPDTLKEDSVNEKIESEFQELLNSDITERDILNFINGNKYYNIIGSILQWYTFGHHEAFLFKEFEFPSTHKADYLLIGRSSGGYSFVFIELENPYGQITQKNGEFGDTFRKGIKQVEDWDSWLESNYSSLSLIFDKYKSVRNDFPREFYKLDKSRLNFVVIAGRRNDFSEKTYEISRRYLKRNNIRIAHYDNLVDSYKDLIKFKNY